MKRAIFIITCLLSSMVCSGMYEENLLTNKKLGAEVLRTKFDAVTFQEKLGKDQRHHYVAMCILTQLKFYQPNRDPDFPEQYTEELEQYNEEKEIALKKLVDTNLTC